MEGVSYGECRIIGETFRGAGVLVPPVWWCGVGVKLGGWVIGREEEEGKKAKGEEASHKDAGAGQERTAPCGVAEVSVCCLRGKGRGICAGLLFD